MIYHVTIKESWQNAVEQGFYEAESLHSEGFIHTSKAEQVQGVLKRYYSKEKDLLLLHIDEKKVTSEIKWELAPSVNETFPHIYGRLDLDAVVKISEIKDGNYEQ